MTAGVRWQLNLQSKSAVGPSPAGLDRPPQSIERLATAVKLHRLTSRTVE